ncbi:shTK domain protein [Ancylostoma ceylanicum]|uniref:ShTK domain protein n=1 Tax=Ancylostoma ceylanicum TaxID=53326 RepID=A0A0D6LHB7_9BILA|nr:shTK domain protein [Ancylostoma ceylanicum]
MLLILIIAALACGSYAGITDLNCTDNNGAAAKYVESAVNCPNKYSDADCEALFPVGAGAVVAPGVATDRPDNCFKENCKRTCGLCSGGGGSTADCGNDAKCTNWVRNGFCTNTFYTADQRKKYCGKPCGLC